MLTKHSDKVPIVDIPCPLCGDIGVRHLISDTVWGAPESFVCKCSACEIVFIHPMMGTEEEERFYEAQFAHYMRERGGPGETEPDDHFQKHQDEGRRRLSNLKPFLHPDMRVLEVGSSTGFLLAAIEPYVASVEGVEPGRLYAEYANQRGIKTNSDLYKVANDRFDLILAYYVVEHLKNPVNHLADFCKMLKFSGNLAIEVPNVDDALLSFYELDSFSRFYWQKAHYFNYSHRTLEKVLLKAGFGAINIIPEQRYDISNHIHWLTKGEPGGKGKYTHVFDEKLNREYTRCLKDQWMCDTIFAVAKK